MAARALVSAEAAKTFQHRDTEAPECHRDRRPLERRVRVTPGLRPGRWEVACDPEYEWISILRHSYSGSHATSPPRAARRAHTPQSGRFFRVFAALIVPCVL